MISPDKRTRVYIDHGMYPGEKELCINAPMCPGVLQLREDGACDTLIQCNTDCRVRARPPRAEE